VDAAQSPRVHLTVETADEELFLKEFSTLLHSGAYLVRRVAPAGGGLERVFAELTLDAGSESQ
jgi:hypothetical protein